MLDHGALALTGLTGRDVDEAPEDVALGAPHFAGAAADGAGDALSARLAARATADGAMFESRGANLFLAAEDGLLEIELDLDAQVAATNRAGGAASAKERIKDVAEAAKVEALEAGPLGKRAGRAVLVVLGPLLRVGEHLVGSRDALELGLGDLLLRRIGYTVRVVLHRQLAKRSPNVVSRGFPREAKDFVEVVGLSHRAVSVLDALMETGYRAMALRICSCVER